MDKELTNFLSKIPLHIIEFAIIALDILIIISDIKKSISEEFFLILIFLGIVSFIHLSVVYLPKIFSYFKFTNNFENLPKEHQKILFSLFEKKHNLSLYNRDVIYLHHNKYIQLIQKINAKEATFSLSKKMRKFLDKKIQSDVLLYLQNLSNEEKNVLNLFYNDKNMERYPNSYLQALELLIDKKIIQYKNDKYIEISKYGLKELKKIRSEKAKIEIELGKHNILASQSYGGGAPGSRVFFENTGAKF